MTLLLFLLLGVLIGFFRGGGVSGLTLVGIRGLWLLLVSLAVQLLDVFLVPLLPGFVWLMPVVQAARFLPLLLFVALNFRHGSIRVAGLGAAMNFLVILLNGGKMPILWSVVDMPALAASVQRVLDGRVPDYFIMSGPGTARLWWLGDVLHCPYLDLGFASVGDLVLGIGLLLFVQNSMVRYSVGRHARGSLLPRQRRYGDAAAVQEAEPNIRPTKQTAEVPEPVVAEPAVPAPKSTKAAPSPAPEPKSKKTPPAQPEPEARPSIKLPPRLEEIAAMIPLRATVADVGCDHGKLAVYLALRGTPKVVATDVSADSLAKTTRLAKDLSLNGLVQTRLGDGLQRLKPGEADVIVLAGMGGTTICGILEAGIAVAEAAQSLLLQPMNAQGTVRRWLMENGFTIVDETLAAEEERVYQIIRAEPGEYVGRPYSLFELEVGRTLVDRRHPLLGRLLEQRIALVDEILGDIAGNSSPRAEARRSELQNLRVKCEEVVEWLRSERSPR